MPVTPIQRNGSGSHLRTVRLTQGSRVNSVSPGGIATDRLIELFGTLR